MSHARNNPTTVPKRMPSGSEFTLRANQPIAAPAMIPLTVDPMTMPTMPGAVSGADTSAESPSKIPRTPPSSMPNTGLFMIVLPLDVGEPSQPSQPSQPSCSVPTRLPLTSREDDEKCPKQQIHHDQQDRGPILEHHPL